MTIEERFERIAHLTAGMPEERRKDREEYKALWRETQRHLSELSTRMIQLADESAALAAEGRETNQRLRELGESTDQRFRATDQRLRELGEATDARIAALVSAIGQHIRHGHP